MMVPSTATPQTAEDGHTAATVLRWRSWPLVDHARWSWIVPMVVVFAGVAVWRIGGSPLLGVAAAAALSVTLWRLLLPIDYEINRDGYVRRALGRSRLIPWHVVRSYRPRATGIVLFLRPDPTPIDALRSEFLSYGDDEDETLCAVREYAAHAVELPS